MLPIDLAVGVAPVACVYLITVPPAKQTAPPGSPNFFCPSATDTDALLERYATTSGHDLDDIDFYRVLATFKLAVISEGAHARLAKVAPERAPRVRATVDDLAAAALDLADGSSIAALRGRARASRRAGSAGA